MRSEVWGGPVRHHFRLNAHQRPTSLTHSKRNSSSRLSRRPTRRSTPERLHPSTHRPPQPTLLLHLSDLNSRDLFPRRSSASSWRVVCRRRAARTRLPSCDLSRLATILLLPSSLSNNSRNSRPLSIRPLQHHPTVNSDPPSPPTPSSRACSRLRR